MTKNIEKAVEAIKQRDIINLFDCLCLPFEEGKGLKEELFLNIFKAFEIEARYEKGVGVLIPAKKEAKKIVVSHMDLIPTFLKGFEKGKKYKIEEGKLIGALDNTITNAVAMIAAVELAQKEDIEFVFTEGEETGFWGMKSYMEKFHKEDFFYINMDVTNDAWKNHISIEYDNPNFQICKQLCCLNAGFTKERDCDDLDVVVDKKGYGFSYCLPTKSFIHSYKNYTMIEKLEPYLEGLIFILKELDISKKKHDIKELEIKKALTFEYEVFKKKEKKKRKRREKEEKEFWKNRKTYEDLGAERIVNGRYSNNSSGKVYYAFGNSLFPSEDLNPIGFDEVPPIEEEYDEELISMQDISNLEKITNDCFTSLLNNEIKLDKYIRSFIHDKVFSQEQWSKDSLAGYINDFELAEKIITILDDELLLITIEPGSVYKFPLRSEYSI